MSTLQLWMVAGGLVGAGLACLAWWLVPAHPEPVQALERLSSPVRRSPAPEPVRGRGGLEDRLGLWAMRRLPARLWANAPRHDLALMGKPLHVFYGEKVVFVATAAVSVPLLSAVFSRTLPMPVAVPAPAPPANNLTPTPTPPLAETSKSPPPAPRPPPSTTPKPPA